VTDSTLPAKLGALVLFIDDVKRSKAFYERIFGVEPLFEDATSVAYRFGDTVLNLAERSGAPELIEPARVAAADAGSSAMFTIWVRHCDEACTTLADLGVGLVNGPMDRAWGVRTATFQDPDGHVWEVAQQLG